MKQLLLQSREKLRSLWSDYGYCFVVLLSLLVSFGALSVLIESGTHSRLEVSFLDIGQGDAIFIRTPSGHEVLIDGGPSDVVLSQLDKEMSYFDRSIDMIIATHDDADHVTGLIPVLAKYDVDHIVRSPVQGDTQLAHDLLSRMKEEHAELHVGEQGDVIDFGDGVMMYVLSPTETISPHADTNDASVAVVITYGEHSFLLTGDLPTKYESNLFSPHLSHHVTVFKAGHHGSKTSSGEELLSYIHPEYAVISAGKNNRYGHPNRETLERLSTYTKETLSTIDRGTITFESDGNMLSVKMQK